MTAYFESGWGAGDALDWWSVLVQVKDGPNSGFYISSGTSTFPLKKAEVELSGRTAPEMAAIHANFATIQTRGDAEAYARSVLAKVRIAHEQRKHMLPSSS